MGVGAGVTPGVGSGGVVGVVTSSVRGADVIARICPLAGTRSRYCHEPEAGAEMRTVRRPLPSVTRLDTFRQRFRSTGVLCKTTERRVAFPAVRTRTWSLINCPGATESCEVAHPVIVVCAAGAGARAETITPSPAARVISGATPPACGRTTRNGSVWAHRADRLSQLASPEPQAPAPPAGPPPRPPKTPARTPGPTPHARAPCGRRP